MARVINDRYIFIHIAKTGGTFFRESLNYFGVRNYEIGIKHAAYDPETHGKYIPIAFVRHPLSWYLSRWRYAVMTRFKEKTQYNSEARAHWMARVWHDDFATFCGKIANSEEFKDGKAWTYFNQMIPVEHHGGFIYRYENLIETTWQFLHFGCGLNIAQRQVQKMPRQLDSSPIPYTVPTVAVQQILLSHESKLINQFYPDFDHEQIFTKGRRR